MTDYQRLLNRYEDWWQGKNSGLPLMHVVARREGAPDAVERPATPEAYYTDIDYLMRRFEVGLDRRVYLADAFPAFSADLGPGSLALYLGTEPEFAWDTVWYRESITDLERHPPLVYDDGNLWWRRHRDMLREAKAKAAGRYRVCIPDLIENIDILAAMRGTQNTLYDMMDEPELVLERLDQIKDVYFRYYDAFYDLLKEEDMSSSYTAFQIQGRGRVAKLQCDFSAMMSPKQFRTFVLPSLQDQVRRVDRSLYHLDGPDAIRHVPAIMELKELNALQWTCGAGQPDGGCDRWYGIYDAVIAAGKSLWIQIYDGDVHEWMATAERLMSRYDMRKLYFIFPEMTRQDAETLLNRAEGHWQAK